MHERILELASTSELFRWNQGMTAGAQFLLRKGAL
jgi:hypothetical protein